MKGLGKNILLLFAAIAISGCNGIGSGDGNTNDTAAASGYVDSMSRYNDELESAETDDQKAHAVGLLEGRISPGNDSMTIRCLDSVMSHNPATRRLYFKVLQVIVADADGALAELTSGYLKTILYTFPAEFLRFYSDPNTMKEAVEDLIAFEFEGVTTNEQDVYFAAIQRTCNNCSAADKELIETLKKTVAAKAHHATITDEPQR